jgi:hypothetical protein
MLRIDARRDFGSRAASGDIPQLQATAIRIKPDERLRIVNHLGQQVLDTWIFAADAPYEFMSMEHCRDQLYKLFFEVGDELISNRRRPLARISADTSPGGLRLSQLSAPGPGHGPPELPQQFSDLARRARRPLRHRALSLEPLHGHSRRVRRSAQRPPVRCASRRLHRAHMPAGGRGDLLALPPGQNPDQRRGPSTARPALGAHLITTMKKTPREEQQQTRYRRLILCVT